MKASSCMFMHLHIQRVSLPNLTFYNYIHFQDGWPQILTPDAVCHLFCGPSSARSGPFRPWTVSVHPAKIRTFAWPTPCAPFADRREIVGSRFGWKVQHF